MISERVTLTSAAAVFAAVAAWFFYAGFTTPIEVSGMANLELMHIQMLDIAIGIGAAVVSALFAVGASLAR